MIKSNACYHQLFEAQAQRAPHAPALEFGDVRLNYGELDGQANRLARHLLKLGVGTECLVGIAVRRSPDMIAALLAIAKAGAAYVPLDPEEDTARRDEIITSTDLSAVLVNGCWRPQHLPPSVALVDLVADRAAVAANQPSSPDISVTPRHLAYLLHTSGSTGQPKGVAMEHASLSQLLEWHSAARSETRGLRTLQFCSIGFDFSFHEIFSTLSFGGTLVMASEEERHDPVLLARRIQSREIEKLFLPVSALLNWASAVEENVEFFPDRLRHVFTTGEQLSITPALRAIFAKSGASLHNQYGATEFQDAATFTLTGDPLGWPDVVPIGHPLVIRSDRSRRR